MVVIDRAASGWAVQREPHSGIWVKPVDGWGFVENIDGRLSLPFEICAIEGGVRFGNVSGWRAQVLSSNHKYSGMHVEMTPRHVPRDRWVVVSVRDGEALAFSGMADTTGLVG